MAYMMAYALAGFTTFASILGRGRSRHEHDHIADNEDMDIIMCGCSGSDHDFSRGFVYSIKQTFLNFGTGLRRMTTLYRQPGARKTIKSSLIVLFSAESGCIIAAATVDVMMYQYSTILSIPSALLVGTFTVAAMSAYRSSKFKPMQEQKKK